MSSFKCSTVLSADISGNVRKSSESRRKFSEVAGTFPEIPVLTKSHTFDAEKVGQYRVRVISVLTQTHITVKERDLLHFFLFWTSGAPNDAFLQNTLKTLFRLSRVLLDLQKCILSGATKFLSVRSSQGNLSLFEITRASVLFFRKFQV